MISLSHSHSRFQTAETAIISNKPDKLWYTVKIKLKKIKLK